MSDPIVSFDEAAMRGELKELVRRTVEDTLNALLEEEADDLIGADRYERTAGREAYRAGHYERGLTTTSGQVTLRMPKLKGMRFATAIIERYKRREASVEEWRSRPLTRKYPYVFVDGIYLKRSWGGSFENVAVMVAIGVNDDGYREVIGAAEGFTESAECWREFLSWLKGRGLSGVRMFTGDKAAAMTGAIAEVFPDAAYQRCTVHFYRNVLSKVPKSKRAEVAAMLKAVHAQESLEASTEKAGRVAAKLEDMRLAAAAKCVRDGVAETLTYTRFPARHWRRIRTNNVIERLNREIRRRTRVVGTFPDGKSALMLVTARLKYVADSEWGSRRYLDVSLLDE